MYLTLLSETQCTLCMYNTRYLPNVIVYGALWGMQTAGLKTSRT